MLTSGGGVCRRSPRAPRTSGKSAASPTPRTDLEKYEELLAKPESLTFSRLKRDTLSKMVS